jgi:plastocyanin
MAFRKVAASAAVLTVWLAAVPARAQQQVTVHVDVAGAPIAKHGKKAPPPDSSNVAVWLVPLDATGQAAAQTPSTKAEALIVQKNKMFDPHVTIVRVGSSIAFPNEDPFFHNVFSLYNGKRFDLGLYEAGTTRTLRFDRLGVSYLFCNIHENMSAIVIAVDTPFYGLSDHTGKIAIADVPDGRYTLHVFYERSTADQLKGLDRTVTISPGSRSIDAVHVAESPAVTLAHKNKYGEDYIPPPSSGYGP